jgi:hypothetical protein
MNRLPARKPVSQSREGDYTVDPSVLSNLRHVLRTRHSRRQSLTLLAGLTVSAAGLMRPARTVRERATRTDMSSQEGARPWAVETFHLTMEETQARWGDCEGWVFSGLRIAAEAGERVAIELWDPHVSYEDPILWHESDTHSDRDLEIVAGIQTTAPYVVRIAALNAQLGTTTTLGGGLLPSAICPPKGMPIPDVWGGPPASLDTCWVDWGVAATGGALDSPLSFAWISWNGPETGSVLGSHFRHPALKGSRGRSVVVQWSDRLKELAGTPLPDWPHATWVWCLRRV